MKKVPIGEYNFKELIVNDNYYVDKTQVIEDILKNGSKVFLFPRPRRFGKSLLISMLENFFDIDKKEENKDLFKNLYISKNSYYKELSKYPVIKLDFKEVKSETYESFLNNLKILISNLYTRKSYVKEILSENELKEFKLIESKESNQDELSNSIRILSEWLERYHKEKVVILIDEYDAPISQGYIDGFYNEVMSIMKKIFSSSLKGNDSLKIGIMTGILRVSRESIFSDFNNVSIYDVMSKKYNEYFGFTEKETAELLKSFKLELTDRVKDYYDGYNFCGVSIYNPWSILNYVDKLELVPYWANTSSNLLIKKCLSKLTDEEKLQIEKLIQGESLTFDYNDRLTYKDFDKPTLGETLNLLLASGYLTLDREEESVASDLPIKFFKIPNFEVQKELIRIMQHLSFGRVLSDLGNYEEFLSAFINDDKVIIEKFINDLMPGTSFFDIKYEFSYEMYISGMLGSFMNKNFIVKSNRESGTGRSDILIEKVDRSFGMVIEIKVAGTHEEMEYLAKTALNQIEEHEYCKELELDKVKVIKKYAIVFYNKSCIVR